MQPVTDKEVPAGMEKVVADVAAEQKSDKTTVQNLTYTTTGTNGQSSTCTASYSETLSNVGANGQLNKPGPSGVNFEVKPDPGKEVKVDVKRSRVRT